VIGPGQEADVEEVHSGRDHVVRHAADQPEPIDQVEMVVGRLQHRPTPSSTITPVTGKSAGS
jgi:hypothetical protein